MTPRFTLDYGVRWDLYTPITERARRTSGILTVNGMQEYVINPQPGYRTDWHALGPRIQVAWQVTNKLSAHAGGSIMTIPPNIWQDNFLTGSTPFAVYPRLLSASNAPIHYGFQITPSELPNVYTPQGANIFASGKTKAVAPNTVMDVNRYEQDMAALTPGHGVSDLSSQRHRSLIRQRHALHMDRGPGAQAWQPYRGCELCGHRTATSCPA